MNMKQDHCIPICTTPNKAAKQAPPEMYRQQAISSRLAGRTTMLERAQMELRAPRPTNHGDRPSLDPRRMILRC